MIINLLRCNPDYIEDLNDSEIDQRKADLKVEVATTRYNFTVDRNQLDDVIIKGIKSF